MRASAAATSASAATTAGERAAASSSDWASVRVEGSGPERGAGTTLRTGAGGPTGTDVIGVPTLGLAGLPT